MAVTQITRRDYLIASFAALAIGIHVIEASLPSPLPGVKPGLANVVTLLVLLRYDFRAALWVAGLRVLVGSLIVGSFMSPTFMLSFSGAVAAMIGLAAVHFVNSLFAKPLFSALGYSLVAACLHIVGQLMVAGSIFLPAAAVWSLAPILLTTALVFGYISGYCAQQILQRLPPLEDAIK